MKNSKIIFILLVLVVITKTIQAQDDKLPPISMHTDTSKWVTHTLDSGRIILKLPVAYIVKKDLKVTDKTNLLTANWEYFDMKDVKGAGLKVLKSNVVEEAKAIKKDLSQEQIQRLTDKKIEMLYFQMLSKGDTLTKLKVYDGSAALVSTKCKEDGMCHRDYYFKNKQFYITFRHSFYKDQEDLFVPWFDLIMKTVKIKWE